MQALISHEEQQSVNSNGPDTQSALKNVNSRSKMTLFVRSKKVAVASKTVTIPVYVNALSGSNKVSKRITIYENVLDEEQKDALENSAALAKSLGIELEVRDVATFRIFTRIISSIFRDKFVTRTPSVSFAGEAITSLVSASHPIAVPRNYKVPI